MSTCMPGPDRRVWYQLVRSSDGKPYVGTSPTTVRLAPNASIASFREAVRKDWNYPGYLREIRANWLEVFKNKSTVDEPMDAGENLGLLGESPDDPLIVAVPPPGDNQQFHLFYDPSAEIPEAVRKYDERAQRIQANVEAKQYIEALCDVFTERKYYRPFNAICAPTGTGKTQFAFTLPKDRCACIYLHIDSANKGFAGYMAKLVELFKVDFETMHPPRDNLWLYGFLAALIRLLQRHPELNLPTDLCRLRIGASTPEGVASETFSRAPSHIPESALGEWSRKFPEKQIVFFLDEFAVGGSLIQEELEYLRRSLWRLRECLIVASSDSDTFKMFKTLPEFSGSRGQESEWVNLCTQLPKYVAAPAVEVAIDNCEISALKEVFRLCLRSRPLFAEAVVETMQSFLANPSAGSIVELFDNMRIQLEERLRGKTLSVGGCFGNVVAMLFAGGCLVGANESLRRLTHESWAYLVSDREILKKDPPTDGEAKKQRMNKNEDILMRLSSSHVLTLTIWLRSLSFRAETYRTRRFSDIPFFPDPKDDLLLYLALGQAGLFVGDERISVAKLFQLVANNVVPSFTYLDALACAAFFTACNAGSITGCTLEQLITRFVSELIVPTDSLYPKLEDVGPIRWSGRVEFKAQFVMPFDTNLPMEVYQVLNAVQSSRLPTTECLDAVTYTPNGSDDKPLRILVMTKSTTKSADLDKRISAALEPQIQGAKVTFIVVDGHSNSEIRYDPAWTKGDYLNARVYLVEVDASKKVTLKPIDGKSKDAEADRLIIIICLVTINRPWNTKRIKKNRED